MAFYLSKAIFVNRAPIDNLELEFKERGISVLTAVNGKGKTTILSYIVDAFYELAKLHYTNEFEGRSKKYYRVSSSLYNIDTNKPSFVYLRFMIDGEQVDYLDIRNDCSQTEYESAINIENKIPYSYFSEDLKSQNNVKYWHINSNKANSVSSVFDHYVLTYFPSYRYETPSFLSEAYDFKIDFKIDSAFSGYLKNPIEVRSGSRQIANWIMDVVIDWLNYRETQQIQLQDGSLYSIDKTPEHTIWNNINEVLRKTLSSKQYEGTIRMGIGRRELAGIRLSIVADNNGKQTTVSPNIFSLSSGELALLCSFGEILRQADNITPNINLKDITGIVLIDEVDKHLHIKLQKEILPQLFNLFPNVQFVVSTHSPFLNMGLADEAVNRTTIFDLDNNGIVSSPVNTDLYREAYQIMISENNRFAEKYAHLKDEISMINKPIIITEGKTDIKYIQKAKEVLKISDIDFEIISKESQPSGDDCLLQLLEQLSRVNRSNNVIGIFDHDNESIIKKIESNGQKVKGFGNNVYAFCIPVPQTRIDNGQNKISIEYLFTDDEIKTPLKDGRRLFFGSEFSKQTSYYLGEDTLIINNQNERGVDKIIENNGRQAVYDKSGKNYLAKKDEFAEAIKDDKIAISSDSWNNFIPIFDTIRDILKQ